MFSNDRKTIGVFLFRTVEEFQNQICQGIIDRATKAGYNVAFFTAFGDYSGNTGFVEGERQIISLPEYEKLDGVILVLDTIDIEGLQEELLEEIRSKCHCPVISIRQEEEGVHNILVDDESAMDDMIRHFINFHEFTKICFMAGKPNHQDTKIRLERFYKVMKENNLTVSDKQIFYGDFWKHKGREACEHFLKDGYMPEAIICCNDHMAIAVASELIDRGIRVPEEVCVSGYDGVREAYTFYPSITTVTVPFYEMGREAVDIIKRHQDTQDKENKESLEKIIVKAKVDFNESCGCLDEKEKDILRIRRNYYDEIEKERRRQVEMTFMSIYLEEIEDFERMSEVISWHNVRNINGYNCYYVCLCEGMESENAANLKLRKYTDNMQLCVGFKERERMENVSIGFLKSELLPAQVVDETPQVFFFTPLHYKNRCLGYQAVSYVESSNSGNLYLSWVVNIENTIQAIIMQKERERLINELEYMHVRDMMTGLFNRRGFEKYTKEQFEHSIESKEPFFTMCLDMDGLKDINDKYGHSEGDNALCILAKALQSAAKSNEVCARMGGDEYAVAAFGKSKKEVEEFSENIQKFLDNYNENSSKPYKVRTSIGVFYDKVKAGTSIEECINKSDDRMYEQKSMRKSRIFDPH